VVSVKQVEFDPARAKLEARILKLCDEEGHAYTRISEIVGVSRGVVAGIIWRSCQPHSRKQQYVIRLHDLLWQFIHKHDARLTGDVVECAEIVLAANEAHGNAD
tara:strand:+ start:178 stop:489 length:312 start_codon:yes stop_codon:yes gene_type:complete